MVLFVGQATKWLSLGAIIGIPMSFVFGVIDDKLGTPVASLVLGITEFLPVIGLMAQKALLRPPVPATFPCWFSGASALPAA